MSDVNMNMLQRKLSKLSEFKLAEVNDFVDFLISKKEEQNLRASYTSASKASFNEIWDNKEDGIYDDL